MIRRIATIDAHAAGQPVRLITGGFPRPRGATMAARRDWLKKRWDRLRRALLREPRGHAGLCGAVLTEPVSAGAHAGLLFMDGRGYAPLSGGGVIAALTIALERRLLQLSNPDDDIAGATFTGAVAGRTDVGGLPSVRARIEGDAWVTGEHELVIDDADPLRDGFAL